MGTTRPLPIADDKKSVFKLIKTKKENFLNLFKSNKREKGRDIDSEKEVPEKLKQNPKVPQVDTIIANFRKLELEKSRQKHEQNIIKDEQNFKEEQNFKQEQIFKEEEQPFEKYNDELKNFTYKIVSDDASNRNGSQSSDDSGFFDKKDVKKEKCIDEIKREIITKEYEYATQNDESEKSLFTRSEIQIDYEDTNKEHKKTSVKVKQTKEDTTTADKQNIVETSEDTDDVTDCFKNLNLEDGKKQKRVQTVALARGPDRSRLHYGANAAHPYINQINKQTFSGGQVTVNSHHLLLNEEKSFNKLSAAFNEVEHHQRDWLAQGLAKTNATHDDLDILLELIDEDSVKTPKESVLSPESVKNLEEPLSDFILKEFDIQPNYHETLNTNPEGYQNVNVPETDDCVRQDLNFDNLLLSLFDPSGATNLHHFEEEVLKNVHPYNIYPPTPPKSDNVPSPTSDNSYCPTSVEDVFSSSISSPNSEGEVYQEIPHIDEYSTSLDRLYKEDSNQPRRRNSSSSSMTKKQYKDLVKEIRSGFSNKECCRENRKSCKEFFQERFNKIPVEERKRLLLKVAGLDFKTAYGVLHHVLRALSFPKVESEDIQYSLFALISEQILAKAPALFLDQYGLNLLETAVLRCWGRVELTRYLVRCIRTALKSDAQRSKDECVFKESDDDYLVLQCVRAGDSCAATLAEILRWRDQPLFNIHHKDSEGYSALHLACKEHSVSNPRLHIAHVLLEHGGIDLFEGDSKGKDTALHLAVNSPLCDLQLILLLFSRLDHKEWRKLARCANRSSLTPVDYARSAVKSTTRVKYPPEVLDFLKNKCR